MSKATHFDIGGMTCINCQNKIKKALNKTKGVIKASVSYSEGTADIEYDEKVVNERKLIRVIENLDYKVLPSGATQSPDIVRTIGILAIIGALYYMLQKFGLLNRLVPSQLADTGMGYGMLFVIGLITSVHCVAMCGGIGLSQSLPTKEGSNNFVSGLLYNAGRVCSYTAIGFVLGLFGSVLGDENLGVPVMVQAVLKIAVGLIMAIMGINMLGIFPQLRRLSIHTPVVLQRFVGNLRKNAKGPFLIGLLNGFMPCGSLQAMWVVAFATANPFAGALSMLMFSLGTVPLMLGLGSVVTLLGKKFTSQVMKVGAVLVVVLGLVIMTQGGALSGMLPVAETNLLEADESSDDIEDEISEETVQKTSDVQEIKSTLGRGSYPQITVQSGVPVRWTIDAPAENINGCNGVMIIPDYNIQKELVPGENVIEFTPDEPGVYSYSCWMGMVYGSITVTE